MRVVGGVTRVTNADLDSKDYIGRSKKEVAPPPPPPPTPLPPGTNCDLTKMDKYYDCLGIGPEEDPDSVAKTRKACCDDIIEVCYECDGPRVVRWDPNCDPQKHCDGT